MTRKAACTLAVSVHRHSITPRISNVIKNLFIEKRTRAEYIRVMFVGKILYVLTSYEDINKQCIRKKVSVSTTVLDSINQFLA